MQSREARHLNLMLSFYPIVSPFPFIFVFLLFKFLRGQCCLTAASFCERGACLRLHATGGHTNRNGLKLQCMMSIILRSYFLCSNLSRVLLLGLLPVY